jgi:hypothetical protein
MISIYIIKIVYPNNIIHLKYRIFLYVDFRMFIPPTKTFAIEIKTNSNSCCTDPSSDDATTVAILARHCDLSYFFSQKKLR